MASRARSAGAAQPQPQTQPQLQPEPQPLAALLPRPSMRPARKAHTARPVPIYKAVEQTHVGHESHNEC